MVNEIVSREDSWKSGTIERRKALIAMWIIILVLIGGVIAIIAGIGSASSKNRSSNTYVGTRVGSGKTSIIITDANTGKYVSGAKGSTEFYALDKLLGDEEEKLNDCTSSVAMKHHLDVMEAAMEKSGHTIPANERSFYRRGNQQHGYGVHDEQQLRQSACHRRKRRDRGLPLRADYRGALRHRHRGRHDGRNFSGHGQCRGVQCRLSGTDPNEPVQYLCGGYYEGVRGYYGDRKSVV